MTDRIRQNASQQALVRQAENESKFPSTPSGEVTPNRSTSPFRNSVTARQWVAVAVLCYVNLINYMDRFTIAGILDDIVHHFSISSSEAGLLQTVFIVSYMVFAPLFGYMGDRYSRKWIMAFGVFLWSLTTLLGSFMPHFGGFIATRAMVGIGEASYSTIAPTLISDMFAQDVRSVMLAIFYFAIPIGSGLGYIVGSKAAVAGGSWQWGLRVTPALGLVAVVLIITVLYDPPRGHSDSAGGGGASGEMRAGSWAQDLRALTVNVSFLLGTLGFTCVAFVAGALAWWGPTFVTLGLQLQLGAANANMNDVAFIFGVVTMLAGLAGVSLGAYSATKLRAVYPRADPLVCGGGLLVSAPLMFAGAIVTQYSVSWAYVLFFFGQVFLNLNWSIVADMLLYVVVPTRRSTAEAMQILASHLLGDAGSPYLIGVVSDGLQRYLSSSSVTLDSTANGTAVVSALTANSTVEMLPQPSAMVAPSVSSDGGGENLLVSFHSLQYALFITVFVEVLGGFFFLLNAVYIVRDRERARRLAAGLSCAPVAASTTGQDTLVVTSSLFADDPASYQEQTHALLT